MTDLSTPEFLEMKRRAAARAAEIVAQSYDAACPRCGRVTWHYLVTVIGQQQVFRCAGCGCETLAERGRA